MEYVDDASFNDNLSLRGPVKQDVLLTIQEAYNWELVIEYVWKPNPYFLSKWACKEHMVGCFRLTHAKLVIEYIAKPLMDMISLVGSLQYMYLQTISEWDGGILMFQGKIFKKLQGLGLSRNI